MFNKAESLINNSFKIYIHHYGHDHVEMANILMSIGQLQLLKENLEEAKNCFKKALSIYGKNKHLNAYKALEKLVELNLKQAFNCDSQSNVQKINYFKSNAKLYSEQALKVVENHLSLNSPHYNRIKASIRKL